MMSRRLLSLLLLPFRYGLYGRYRADVQLRIVTGADSSHFRSLIALLESIRLHEAGVDVVVWNLGLRPEEDAHMRWLFPQVVVKTFDYSAFPRHFDITVDAGCYAWKPVIINEECKDSESLVLWLDAGCLIIGRLRWIRRFIQGMGIYSPFSSGTIGDWTHPATLHEMGASGLDIRLPNFAACVVGIMASEPRAMLLIDEWSTLSHRKECIAPTGSSRANHRQDQALLTVLMYQHGLTQGREFRQLDPQMTRVLIHQDCD